MSTNATNAQTAANQSMTIPRFFLFPVQNPVETKKQGRPIFDDIEVCEVRFSGNREKVIHAPAHEVFRTDRDMEGNMNEITYAIQFSEQYRAFKMGDTQLLRGTPISELPFLTVSKRLELKALNIHTAEALAALDGNNLKMLGMGGRELKVQAQTYLDNAKESAGSLQLASLNAALEERIKQLEARLSGGAVPIAEEGDETPPLAAPDDPNASPFFGMGSDDIKNWIQEATGARPLGNPNHATLVARADAVNAEIKAKREQQTAA
jgi:hypothetical protein